LATLRVSADFTITKCDEPSIREALANGPIIKFSCDGTITLTNNLTISDEIVFDASGHAVTISGGQKARVFQVNTGVNLTLINLTVANGYSTNGGGGIYNDGGRLSLINCTLSGNRAVGSSKDWVTTNQGLTGDNASGGAVYNSGAFFATNTTFTSNSAVGGSGGPAEGNSGDGGDAWGGAIYSLGTVSLANCNFKSNAVTGGQGGNNFYSGEFGKGFSGGVGGDAYGGAIASLGLLSVTNSTFASNSAMGGSGGNGSDDYFSNGGDGENGGGGYGGCVYQTNGVFNLTESLFSNNRSKGGSGGAGGFGQACGECRYGVGGRGGAAGDGFGGAILCLNCQVNIMKAALLGNDASGGAGGEGGGGTSNGGKAGNGGRGSGGGVGIQNELARVTLSTLSGNTAQGGRGGNAGLGGGFSNLRGGGDGANGFPGGGFGGGLFTTNGTVGILSCTFSQNAALGTNGFDGKRNSAGTPGSSARGGGVFNGGLMLALTNSTFFANTAVGGNGSAGGPATIGGSSHGDQGGDAGAGGGGNGGGLYNASSHIAVSFNCTFSNNGAQGGAGGKGGPGIAGGASGADGIPGASSGGGIANDGGTVTSKNSIFAYSAGGGEGSGVITDGGNNISFDNSLNFTDPGSSNNTDPKLGLLADNGGSTKTAALLPGSPAIDAITDSICPTTDQRGVQRPQGARCDIGAYEFTHASVGSLPDGRVHIEFSAVPNRTYFLQTSSNLTDWADAGGTLSSVDGKAEFEVNANLSAQFFRTVTQ